MFDSRITCSKPTTPNGTSLSWSPGQLLRVRPEAKNSPRFSTFPIKAGRMVRATSSLSKVNDAARYMRWPPRQVAPVFLSFSQLILLSYINLTL